MALFLEATFVTSDGNKVIGVCQATGTAGKQQVFKLSATPDLPSDSKVILRLGSSLQATMPRLIEEKDESLDKAWAKAGSVGDPLVVQMLLKKQVTDVMTLWKLSKVVVTCAETTLPQHFIPSQRITCADEEGAAMLLAAAREGDVDDLAAALGRGGGGMVHVDYQNEGGSTALHYAAANGHDECVAMLLQRGARVVPNASGNTPLHWAVLNKNEGAVKALLAASGVDVLAKNGFGRSALTEAFAAEQQDVTLMLLQHASASALDDGEGVEEGEVDEKEEADVNAGEDNGGMEVDGGDAMQE